MKLRTDGGLKTGRDIVIAAILGAEEFGIGTLSLRGDGLHHGAPVPFEHLPGRRLHAGRQAQGKKFVGTPEKVINLMTFIAEEVREILARLGVRSLDEIIGRTELLRQVSRGAEHLDDLDLNPILAKVDAPDHHRRFSLSTFRNDVPEQPRRPDAAGCAARCSTRREKMQLTYTVRNTHRAVGTRFSAEIVSKYGMNALADGHVHIRLRGSAGQSLGAFACKGITLEVFGDANDYVGKGPSGATIVVRPHGLQPARIVGERDRRQHRALRCHRRPASSRRVRRASASPCAIPARTWWSRAAARMAANNDRRYGGDPRQRSATISAPA